MASLCEALVAVDSVNPDLVAGAQGEGHLAQMVAAWLEARGVEVALEEVVDGRANVIGVVRGSCAGAGLMLNAHLDTVGLGPASAGTRPSRHEGRLYGRGAQDTKSGLAAAMTAVAALVGAPLRRDVVLAAVVDEEGESKGTEALLRGWTADAAIVLEPTAHAVVPVHKGFVWAQIDAEGVAAHGSDYVRGVDAIRAMGHILVELDRLDRRLQRRDVELVGPPSLHASLVTGGREVPTYPDLCSLVLERRTVPGEAVGDVMAELQAAAATARTRDRGARWSAKVSMLMVREPLATPMGAPVVQAVLTASRNVLGGATVAAAPFWTDAALMSVAGIPSVVFGPSGGGMHSSNEWVDVGSVVGVADVLHAVAMALCG
ncbi:MAG TPA: M20/M25/M40 family metallo-hydrolase [Acidimicrobiales bacterium]|nr:M20/M25/M40 family metallo-hydrolase [Acidimicrobiales bacterium]